MFIPDWLMTLLLSAIFSASFSFFVKKLIEKKLDYHFNVELEKLRHSYNIEIEKLKNSMVLEDYAAQGLIERRFDLYPKMIELIYRIRNMVRELASSKDPSPMLIEELIAREEELEENLYLYRMDLERDGFLILFTRIKTI